jgi:sigma-B regulation protein RsbU (phosphoserine phosphatase)
VGLLSEASYPAALARLEPGDLLLLYTDGVVECESPSGEELGEEGLAEIVAAEALLPAPALCDRILDAADGRRAGGPREDDMTVVVMRVR